MEIDNTTLQALAEQLAPLVVQTLRAKNKREVSELSTVKDYTNIHSMPCYYWDKSTGEKYAVTIDMDSFVSTLKDSVADAVNKAQLYKIRPISAADYANLTTKQSDVMYCIYE